MSTQAIQAAGGKTALSHTEALAAMNAAQAKPNTVSDAARTLGQRAAQARQERQAQAPVTQEPVETEEVEQEAQQAEVTPEGEAEASTTDETQALPEEGQEPTPEPVKAIEVDGIELTAEEISRGYLRQADYTQKTQALSEKAKAFDTSVSRLNDVVQTLEAQLPQQPNWLELAKTDPLGYVQAQAEWQAKTQTLNAAKQALNEETQRRLQAMQAEAAKELKASYWKKPGEFETGLKAVSEYATKSYGFTDQELNSVADHRVIQLLDKARQWDALQASKTSIKPRVEKAPAVQKPGAKLPASSVELNQLKAARERFYKNPTVQNGTALRNLQAAMKQRN